MDIGHFRFLSKEDAFLSEILERPVIRLAANPSGDPLSVLLENQSLQTLSFLRCPLDQTGLLHHLQSSGFMLADILLGFACNPQEITSLSQEPPLANTIRSSIPDDCPAVAAIAENSFRWSRFHRDPFILETKANLIKRRWTENFFSGQRGQSLLVAEENGQIHGFLLALETEREHIIDLIAVAPEGQGRGIGQALVHHFLIRAREKSKMAAVGTQAANIPSVRLYEKLGFRLQSSEVVFHHHKT